MRNLRLARTVVAAAVAGGLVATVVATDPPADELDPRINPDRIGESEPPPLPEQVILPMPPLFRLAASNDEVPISPAHWEKAHAMLNGGLDFLVTRQAADGSWMGEIRTTPSDDPDAPSPIGVAVTALVTKAMVQSERWTAEDPAAAGALGFMMRSRNEDGSFEGGALTNYVTAAVTSALASTRGVSVAGAVGAGTRWMTTSQWDDTEGLRTEQDWYGGAGYGTHGRPDLSNTQLMLDALYDSGMSPDEPAFQRALAFVSRAQNLRATNKSEWTGDDGGFVYTPANGGESMASDAAGEGRRGELIPAGTPRSLRRSYGSMTYAGFKSMLYAGLSADDVRVRAAFDWLRRHWTFDENPGLGQQGLYYYYHTMARALAIGQQTIVIDDAAVEHNWREELIDALAARHQADGSWINEADRWLESQPDLTTAYAVLALQEVLKPVTGTGVDIADPNRADR